MPTLAGPDDVKALGFKVDSFNLDSGTDFDTWLQGVIDKAEAEIAVELGGRQAFNDLVALDADHALLLTHAEAHLAAAELWSRRLIAMDSMDVAMRADNFAQIRGSVAKNAADEDTAAWDLVARATGDVEGSAVASGSIETGPYRSVCG